VNVLTGGRRARHRTELRPAPFLLALLVALALDALIAFGIYEALTAVWK
jgi:hypothetical protein